MKKPTAYARGNYKPRTKPNKHKGQYKEGSIRWYRQEGYTEAKSRLKAKEYRESVNREKDIEILLKMADFHNKGNAIINWLNRYGPL